MSRFCMPLINFFSLASAGKVLRVCLALAAGATTFAAGPLERTSQPLPGIAIKDNAGLFIGVNAFTQDKSLGHLEYAVNDAIVMAHIFVVELRLIPPMNCWLLLDGQPTTTEAKAALDALTNVGVEIASAARTPVLKALLQMKSLGQGADDFAVIFVSSHGLEELGSSYVIPSDGLKGILADTAISNKTLEKTLRESKAGKRVLFLDACRESIKKSGTSAPMPSSWKSDFEAGNDQILITSCDVGQFSYEDPELTHGVFSFYLARGLRGAAAADPKNVITLGAISDYVSKSVYAWAREKKSTLDEASLQKPSYYGPNRGRDMPIAVTAELLSQRARITSALRILSEAVAAEEAPVKATTFEEVRKEIYVLTGQNLEELLQRIESLAFGTDKGRKAFVRWWDSIRLSAAPLRIVTPLTDITAALGSPAKFNVGFEGPKDIEIIWEFQPAGQGPWRKLNVDNAPTLTLSPVRIDDVGLYRVRLQSPNGEQLAAQPARLSVPVPPVILVQPQSVTIQEGEEASFKTRSQGEELTFLWEYRREGSKRWEKVGDATQSYTISQANLDHAGEYRLVVENRNGRVVSEAASLTVKPLVKAPQIFSQPTDQQVSEGQDVSFIAEAQGTATLNYRWELLRNGKTRWEAVGENNRELTLTDVETADSGKVRVRVSNAAGTAESETAFLKVSPRAITFSLDAFPAVEFSVVGDSIYAEGAQFPRKTRVGTRLPPLFGTGYSWQIQWRIGMGGFSQVKPSGEIVDIHMTPFGPQEFNKGSMD